LFLRRVLAAKRVGDIDAEGFGERAPVLHRVEVNEEIPGERAQHRGPRGMAALGEMVEDHEFAVGHVDVQRAVAQVGEQLQLGFVPPPTPVAIIHPRHFGDDDGGTTTSYLPRLPIDLRAADALPYRVEEIERRAMPVAHRGEHVVREVGFLLRQRGILRMIGRDDARVAAGGL